MLTFVLLENIYDVYMNYLSVENLSKSYGIRTLFSDVTFGISQGEKIAFVAKNGSGKSTLMRILCGREDADSGTVTFRRGVSVGFLSQDYDFPPTATIEDIIYGADTPMLRTIRRYERAVHDSNYAHDFQSAYEEMESQGAWEYELRIQTVLSQLKLDNISVTCAQMSGGQLRRLALAQVLIEAPDFLILDEPTNHLDLPMVEWLENYLSGEKITLFMVTHDRYFLDRVCTDILELDAGKLWRYHGNYSYFMEKRAERYAAATAEAEKARNLMRREAEWIRRQPQARGTKAKARIDSFEVLRQKASFRIDERVLELGINMERLGSKVVEMHSVSKSWEDMKILDKFDYVFRRGERVGIVGDNGSGKSTFLRVASGEEAPDSGKVVIGDTVVFGHYRQEGIEINPREKVIEVLKKYGEYIPLAKGRRLSAEQLLERFLFTRSQQWDYVEKLSGGERRRLYLCTVLISNPNFLILDEPTNDLDIITLTVLEEFLIEYPGVLLIVSHDRYFMDKIVDHLFVFEGGGKIKDFPGTYTEYRIWHKSQKAVDTATAIEDEKLRTEKPREKKNRLSYKEQKEFDALEEEIPALESEKKEIESIFASGEELSPSRVNALSARMEEILSMLEEKEERWIELSMMIEG